MNIAIAGYGVEGKTSYEYWASQADAESGAPLHHVTIVNETPVDDAPADAAVITGDGAFSKLNGFDMVVRTAGLAPHKITTDGTVWSATNEFFKQCPAKIIGVTGTKGKGTTSSIIAAMLEQTGKKVHLLGNIGIPALSLLPSIQPEDYVVFELSSYQLWDVQRSPQIAVVLLIEPDHLNVHTGMDDYVQAKAHIAQFQSEDDIAIYHPTNSYSAGIAAKSPGRTVKYNTPEQGSVHVEDGQFVLDGEVICPVDALQLIGQHNVENACAAITAVKQLAISNEQIAAGLQNFSGLPHRLEFVREFDGVEYYNDSFSSAPSATVAAVKSFTKPEILILGGIDKGADFTELATALQGANNIKEIFIIGEIRNKLAGVLRDSGVQATMTLLDTRTMPEIVATAKSAATSGDVIILSPGCASFDMFRDFYDRGDQFREVVQGL